MSDIVNNKIEDYIRKNSSKEPEILKDLNKETHLKVLNPRMLSGHIQGRFLSIITKLIKPKKILEIGTYTGYSAICMAEGLIENGIIHTIDINEELVSIQNKYFAKSKCNNSIIYCIAVTFFKGNQTINVRTTSFFLNYRYTNTSSLT